LKFKKNNCRQFLPISHFPNIMTFKNPACFFWLAAFLVLTSCSSPTVAWNPKTSFSPAAYDAPADFGGEVVTDAISTTATVVSVDHAKRLVVLKRADGLTITYKALPSALGFDAIQAGDQVKVSLAEELAVFLGKNSIPPGVGADTAKLHVRLPDGTQAAAAEVATVVFTAKITAINDWDDTVTLQLPEGLTKTIKVSEFVSVKSSEAAVLVLEKQ
jgi:hypothetical protein